jgi:hypothetical protein
MKIFSVQWYDEDGYGPTKMLSVFVQANDEAEALEIATNYVVSDRWGFEKYEIDRFEKRKIMDVTDQKVICSSYNNLGG